MKKQNISVALYLMGGAEDGGGNAAYDQLLAHQDIVYNYVPGVGDEDDPYKAIIPYHAINYAVITREVETVEAPVDSFCEGGEPTNPLVLTLVSPKDTCYYADGANISFVITYDCGAEEDCHASQPKDDEFNWTIVKQVMFNGEDHTDDENVEGTYELTLANGVATLTMTVSYEGYTASQSLTATEICSYIGG